ncbi:MAG: TlpA family protein disulfide reductase [Brevundimonas sp.]|nr:MAG: TlpA family protein disulfide reductase [Brevundimonas sp.]
MSGSRTAVLVIAAALAVGAIGGGAWLYANRDAVFKGAEAAAPAKSDLARFAQGSLTRLETPAETPPAPDYGFKDRDGRPTSFAAFRGKVVVVNLWAMWCAPCRTEMPTLARLATAYADRTDFVVLPINVDATPDGLADARSFIDVHEPLPLYSDMTFKLPFLFPGSAGAMPKTVILDKQGRIRAGFTGEADWSSPEARALVDALLAEAA